MYQSQVIYRNIFSLGSSKSCTFLASQYHHWLRAVWKIKDQGYVHTILDSFLWRHEKLLICYSVNTYTCVSDMWLSALEIGAAELCLLSQKSRLHNYVCVWTEALSSMIFVAGQKLSGMVCTELKSLVIGKLERVPCYKNSILEGIMFCCRNILWQNKK